MTPAFEENYIKIYRGNAPVIFGAPHGGLIKPKDIKTRQSGVHDIDAYTFDLTELIVREFYKRTNLTAYTVMAKISRTKVDINREQAEAFEDAKAKESYDTFHDFLKQSRIEIEKNFGRGLYIDIHGQSHPNPFIEFGYLLDNETLKLEDHQLKKYQKLSSINTMARFSKESFLEQLKGKNSLGTLMTQNGFNSIPSSKIPYALDGNYFEGAFNTIKYGSLSRGNISGIQIEFPFNGVRDLSTNREKCAKVFVDCLLKFMNIHLNFDLEKRV